MRCNNCKCVIPNHSEYCVYCGHKVPAGDEETLRVFRGGWYDGSEKTYPFPPVYGRPSESAAYYPPRYQDYSGESFYCYEAPYYRQEEPEPGINLLLFNEDGSLNAVNALLSFTGLIIAFILILLLLMLLL